MTKQGAPSTQLSAALPIETKGLSVLSQSSVHVISCFWKGLASRVISEEM